MANKNIQIIRIVEGIFIILNDGKLLGIVKWETYSGLMQYMNKDSHVIHTSTGNCPYMPNEKLYENIEKFYRFIENEEE